MYHMLVVGLGGFIGSILRYQLGVWILRNVSDWRFPANTFTVNVLGCLVAGLLAGLIEQREWFSLETRLFLFTGLLGGFTTFSAFGLETVLLCRRGEPGIAALNVVLSIVCGVAAVWMGFKAIELLAPWIP